MRCPKVVLILFLLFLNGCALIKSVRIQPQSEKMDLKPNNDFIHGMSFTNKNGVSFDSKESHQALKNLRATEVRWTAIVINGFQDTVSSTDIKSGNFTPSLKEIKTVTKTAKKMGLKIMYKFHIDNTADKPDRWRGEIGVGFENNSQWQKWFSSYWKFTAPYIELAQNLGVEMICVGNELTATENREQEWREIITAARKKYSGQLVYGANWWPGVENVSWWQELDFIGVSAYFPLAYTKNPTRRELLSGWQNSYYFKRVENISSQTGKKVIFTEIGYKSMDGAAIAPWEYKTSGWPNLMEQADLYWAAIVTIKNTPWIAGVFWWEWFTTVNAGGPEDTSFTPYDKPAEKLLKKLRRP